MTIDLPNHAAMRDYQHYIHELERMHGWLEVDLVHNCFLMGEEVGELFKAIRKFKRYYDQGHSQPTTSTEDRKAAVAEELVDVFNYVLALANRLDIDMEDAFRRKNAANQTRTWQGA